MKWVTSVSQLVAVKKQGSLLRIFQHSELIHGFADTWPYISGFALNAKKRGAQKLFLWSCFGH